MQITISDILYQLVNGRGLTADVIAETVGVRPETVGQWLSGIKEPGKDSATALLTFYKKEFEIEDEVTLVAPGGETNVADDSVEEETVEQTAVHHTSTESEPATETETVLEADTITDDQPAASETNNEPEDTANMSDKKTTDQEGQSIGTKVSTFFRKPAVRNTLKGIGGAIILSAAAYGGAVGERRRGASTPV
jgi:transcriptional regulator with XRE-family HTH domain